MKNVCLLLLWLLSAPAVATHLLGGYIRVVPTAAAPLQQEIYVILFMDVVLGTAAVSFAEEIPLCFGDGNQGTARRISRTPLAQNNQIAIHVYRATYTYAGPATYTISTSITNRTASRNLPNGAALTFGLSTLFVLNPTLPNQTPTVTLPEGGFRAALNQPNTISLRGTDAENDSLSYALIRPVSGTTTNCGLSPTPQYSFPNEVTRRGVFSINSRTGDLTWNAPTEIGTYIASMLVTERRGGVVLSQMRYEMMIFAEDRGGAAGVIPPYEPAIEGGILTAIPEGLPEELAVYPVPAQQQLRVRLLSPVAVPARIQLIDLNGRMLREEVQSVPGQRHEQVFDVRHLPSGTYLMKVILPNQSHTRKWVKL